MMKNNFKVIILFTVLASIINILYYFLKFDLQIQIDKPPCSAILGLVQMFFFFLYSLIGIWSIFIVFSRFKIHKWRTLIPFSIVLLSILYFVYIPYTDLYQQIYFAVEKENLKQTVEMFQSGELEHYQIDQYIYVTPYRLTSYVGFIYGQKDENAIKMMFCIYRGFYKSSVLIYVSNDIEISGDDFIFYDFEPNWGFFEVEKISKHWYTALTLKEF